MLISISSIDYKQSLFCSKIQGEESHEESHEENKTSVTASVTCKWWAEKPWVVWATRCFIYHAGMLKIHHSCVLCSCLHSSPRIFEQKRDCSQSMSSAKKFACNIREQLFLYWLNCDESFGMDLVTIYYSSFSIWITQLSLNAFTLHKGAGGYDSNVHDISSTCITLGLKLNSSIIT